MRAILVPRLYLFLLIAIALLHHDSVAASNMYKISLATGTDGNPVLTIANTSQYSITAFAMTVDLSSGGRLVEYRSYYDIFVNYQHDWPIGPGDSVTVPVAHVIGSDIRKLTPKVRAILFSDGTTVGEQVWTAALLTRRDRLRSRISSIHDLIQAQTLAKSSGKELVAKIS